MKNHLFCIGIPTINRADLLNSLALKRYVVDFPNTDIFIIDNGNQEIMDHPNIHVHRPGKNYGVSRSWNYLCDTIFMSNAPFALILNDDIYLGKKEHEIKDLIFRNTGIGFFANTGPWCSFLIHFKMFYKIGPFDENIYPAYFEDNDYAYRIKLDGKRFFPTSTLAPEEFRQSMSIAKDASLNKGFEANKQYYIRKWGGMPGEEIYDKPFDGKPPENWKLRV